MLNSTSTKYHIGTNNSSQPFDSVENRRGMYFILYVCILIFTTVSLMGQSFSFYKMCVKASINLHDMLFRGVTRAKMIFFNKNPSGRILNRFAADISNVDLILPNTMFDVLEVSLKLN